MLTRSQITKSATDILLDHGFSERQTPEAWKQKEALVFEDEYAIVGLVLYENCNELIGSWHDDQIVLSETITQRIGRGEPKAAEGYLVLLTGGLCDAAQTERLTSIRYNTKRLRKLVATGDDLDTPADVQYVLQPLLPIDLSKHKLGRESMGLEHLPRLVDCSNIPDAERSAERLISAYKNQDSLLEALHQIARKQ